MPFAFWVLNELGPHLCSSIFQGCSEPQDIDQVFISLSSDQFFLPGYLDHTGTPGGASCMVLLLERACFSLSN